MHKHFLYTGVFRLFSNVSRFFMLGSSTVFPNKDGTYCFAKSVCVDNSNHSVTHRSKRLPTDSPLHQITHNVSRGVVFSARQSLTLSALILGTLTLSTLTLSNRTHAGDKPAKGEFSSHPLLVADDVATDALTGNSAGDLFSIQRAKNGDTLISVSGSPLFEDTLVRIGAALTNAADSNSGTVELGSYGNKIGKNIDNNSYFGQRKSINGGSLPPANFVSTQLFLPAADSANTADDTQGILYSVWNTQATTKTASGLSALSQLNITPTDSGWEPSTRASGMVDSSGIDGLFNVTNSGISPWGSMVLVESMPYTATGLWNHPNIAAGGNVNSINAESIRSMNNYMLRESNPYRYGYLVELLNPGESAADTDDTPLPAAQFVRQYTSGRLSGGSFAFMSDGRTLYRSDIESGLLFKFVSDYAHNPASGNLSVAALIPDYNENNGSGETRGYNIEWVWLGYGNNEAISAWINEYEGMTERDYVAGDTSYLSDADIIQWAEARTKRDLDGNGLIDQSKDDRIAFLESVKASITLLNETAASQSYAVTSLSEDNESLLIALEKENCQYAFQGVADYTGNVTRIELLSSGNSSNDGDCDEGLNGELILSQNSLFLVEPGIAYARIGSELHRVQY